MRQVKNPRDGRLSVMLCKSPDDHKRVAVHRIVAIAFLDNPEGHREINHIDEDPTNNNVSNLEWCSRAYNMNYGKMQLMYSGNRRPVSATKGGEKYFFESIKQAAESVGVKASNISYALKHGNISGGYRWEDANAD